MEDENKTALPLLRQGGFVFIYSHPSASPDQPSSQP